MAYRTYRAYCHKHKAYLVWHEPTSRQVDKLLCPLCGDMHDAVKGSQYHLKGDVQCEARSFVEKKRGR